MEPGETEPRDAIRQHRSRGLLGRVTDVCVLAPLGFVLEARTLVPELADRGRSEIGHTLDTVQERARSARDELEAALRGLGMLPSDDGSRADLTENLRPSAPAQGPQPSEPVPVVDDGIDPESLAIPGYDTLSASQVVPRLAGLEGEELELVRRYESARRGRKTILSRIAQLQER